VALDVFMTRLREFPGIKLSHLVRAVALDVFMTRLIIAHGDVTLLQWL
jgi:hypothetical protein